MDTMKPPRLWPPRNDHKYPCRVSVTQLLQVSKKAQIPSGLANRDVTLSAAKSAKSGLFISQLEQRREVGGMLASRYSQALKAVPKLLQASSLAMSWGPGKPPGETALGRE